MFAKKARGLPFEEGVTLLESSLREYVRNILSMLHPSIVELGERSAVTQLGDPDPDLLIEALAELEKGSPRSIIEDAIDEASRHLPRPDLNARVLILPGDGESRVLVRQMKGVLGFSLGAQAMMIFIWPVEGWQDWLRYTVTHEYAHLVRNLLFPRGLAGGKLIYMRTQEPETLLDAMIVEGLADTFASHVLPQMSPPWTNALDPEQQECIWPRVHRRLSVSDTTEIRRILFGDNDRIPPWTGYTFGYKIVQLYLKSHPSAQPGGIIGIPARTIYEASGFAIAGE
jgi:uncharacterized protein YjaZ